MTTTSSEVKNLFQAFHKAQSSLRAVHKDARNPFFESSYATLENVIDTAKPELMENGLSFTQAPGSLTDNAITVTTMIMHTSGEWMKSDFDMPITKRDPQSTGSAITYACRYALMAILGLPATDDDAESTSNREDKQSPTPKKKVNASLIDEARQAAINGNASLDQFILTLNKLDKLELKKHGDELRSAANEADKM